MPRGFVFDILAITSQMENIVLKVDKRDKKGNAARGEGLIPAVVYGKGKENQALSVDSLDFEKAFRKAGTSTIIELDVSGEKKKVLIQDIDYHPVTDKVIHIDFYEISMKEKITTNVPLKFVGESTAVIDKNGTLVTNKDELEIECLPADLPHEIEVNISSLDDFEKAIHVSDISLSEKIEIKDDPEEMIVTVEPPRTEEELAELEEPISEPEMPESEQGATEEEPKSDSSEGSKTE